MIPVALFVRVSTKEQDYARQVADLTAHAERQGYEIVHIIHETVGRPMPQCNQAQQCRPARTRQLIRLVPKEGHSEGAGY